MSGSGNEEKKKGVDKQLSEEGSSTGSNPGATGGGSESDAQAGSSKGSGSRRGSQTERIQNFVSGILNKLSLGSSSKPKILESRSLESVVEFFKSGKCKNVIVMTGAGISTAAGIPDFRSPGSGLYDNIQKKYKLSDPQVMFEIGFFRTNPEPFYTLAKELFPQELKPTLAHHFISLLHKKGYLLRNYTQNIDGLERIADIPGGKIVEAHGSFHTSHCVKSSCHKEYSFDWIKEKIMIGNVPKCTDCNSTVKPDVVFFGESLPPRFFSSASSDFPTCDLLIIMGTSLVVQPFAYLVNQVSADTPRLLINKEIVGTAEQFEFLDLLQKLNTNSDFDAGVGSFFSKGLDFKSETNRDVALLGTCDDGVLKLAEALGWKDELLNLQANSKTSGGTASNANVAASSM